MKTPAEDLNATADYLETYGWIQGAYKDGAARCVSSAMMEVDCRLAARLEFLNFIGWVSLTCWNDTPGRTQGEVIAKLRECAAGMEGS